MALVSAFALTVRIVAIAFFTFICYLAIGLPLAVLPGYVHGQLGYGSVLAGLAISVQYAATLLSRSHAGRMADTVGPKQTAVVGMAACAVSGVFLLLAYAFERSAWLSLSAIIASRLALGFGELGRHGRGHLGHRARRAATHRAGDFLERHLHLWRPGAGRAAGRVPGKGMEHGRAGRRGAAAGTGGPGTGAGTRRWPWSADTAWRSRAWCCACFRMAWRLGWARWASARWRPSWRCTTPAALGRGAAHALSAFGCAFIGVRLLFAGTITRYGGFRVAQVSFLVEAAGLALLWLAPSAGLALMGAALTGCGFALVFPAIGVEAVARVPAGSRGAALGAYSAFLDLALGVTGPVAGYISGGFGYPAIFLSAALAVLVGFGIATGLYRHAARQARAAAGNI